MTDWEPLTASLQFAGGIINGWQQRKSVKETNKTNLQIARETNQMQLDAMREQNEFNAAQSQLAWDRETEYNNPVSQLKRMRAAGLNPYAGTSAGQQISGNNAGDYAAAQGAAVPALHAPSMMPEPTVLGTAFQNFSLLAGAFKTMAEAKKIGIDTSVLEHMSEDLVKEQANKVKLQEMDQALKQIDLEWLPKKYQTDIEQTKQAIAVAIQDAKLKAAQSENTQWDSYLKIVQRNLAGMNIQLTRKEIERIDKLLPAELKFTEAKTGEARAGEAAGYASANLSNEQAQTVRDTRVHVVDEARAVAELRSQEVRGQILENAFKAETWQDNLQLLKQQLRLNEEEFKRLEEAVKFARQENKWYWFNNTIGRILPEVGNLGAAYVLRKVPQKPYTSQPKSSFKQKVVINGKEVNL